MSGTWGAAGALSPVRTPRPRLGRAYLLSRAKGHPWEGNPSWQQKEGSSPCLQLLCGHPCVLPMWVCPSWLVLHGTGPTLCCASSPSQAYLPAWSGLGASRGLLNLASDERPSHDACLSPSLAQKAQPNAKHPYFIRPKLAIYENESCVTVENPT